MKVVYTRSYYKNRGSDTRIISLYLSGGVTYIGRMRKALLVPFIIVLGISLVMMPASALIQQSVSTTFDGTGQTPAYGEEIATTLVLSAGDSDIKDLSINFQNSDAFIDYSSFKKEINPAGASVNITPTANGFYIDSLPKGPVVTITFNAYPKTLKPDVLHAADIGFSYTQLGQQFVPSPATPATPVTVDLKSSAYHSLGNVNGEVLRNGIILAVGIVLIIFAVVVLFINRLKNRESARETVKLQEQRMQLLNDIYRKVELAENNPAEYDSLKVKLRNEMGTGKSSERDISVKGDSKQPPRESKGGFE